MRAPLPAVLLRFVSLLLLTLGLAAPLIAPAVQAQEAAPAEEGTTQDDPQQALSQLIEVLRDDAAREELLTELEATLEETGAEEAPAEDEAGSGDELRSIGGQIADVSREAVQGVSNSLGQLWQQLVNTPAIFAALSLSELDALWAILTNVAILVVITYGGLIVMRRLVRLPMGRLRTMFTNGGWVAKPVALLLELLLDIAAAAIPFAIGYAIAAGLLGELGVIRLEHTLYLNAFLMIEVVLSVLRTVVSPNLPEQRLVQITDSGAKAVMGWGRMLVSLFVFGQMLVLPLITASVSFAAGRAISVVLLLITLLVAAMAVLAARQGVHQKLDAMIESREAKKGLAFLIRSWHIFALIYIGILAVVALTRSSAEFQAYLWSNVQIALAILVGFIILNVIKRVVGNGVLLPEGMRRRSPELQRQINTIVPAVLKVLRFIVIAAVAIFCLHGLGFFNFVEFVEGEFGARVAGAAITILLILAAAVIVWVAMNSWIDSQINPELAPMATARKRTLFVLLRNALTIALIIITLMFVLSEVGINIAPLLASAGVLGLAIGFGAQKLVQDIITGIFIQLEGAIDVGDVVAVGGISGVVERLTIRSVSLRDVEGSYHIIPFSSVDTVTNFMRGFSYALIDMGVGYRENVEEARAAMSAAFDELRADPEHKSAIIDDFEWLGVNAFGASEVVLRARIKTLPGKQWGIKRAYNAIVKRLFDERDIEIPFPHQTVYFGVGKDGKAPPLHMVRDDTADDVAPEPDDPVALPPAEDAAKPKRRPRRKKEIEGKDMPDKDEGPEDENS